MITKQGGVGRLVVPGVEVPRQHQSAACTQFGQAATDQPGRLQPGLLPLVVKVGVEKQHGTIIKPLAVAQLDPRDHAGQGTSPALGPRPLGRFTQPEMPRGEGLKPLGAVVQRHHLARQFPVIATHPQRGVARQPLGQPVFLKSQRLLGAQQIGLKGLHRFQQELTPTVPVIHPVLRGSIPDVEAHDPHGDGFGSQRPGTRGGTTK